jgi:hypothetical protein
VISWLALAVVCKRELHTMVGKLIVRVGWLAEFHKAVVGKPLVWVG